LAKARHAQILTLVKAFAKDCGVPKLLEEACSQYPESEEPCDPELIAFSDS
jgi:hypothetical protein